jgi:hypothetical protein
MPIIPCMSKSSARNEPTGYPEFGVRKEAICNFFTPPMPSSTFHDRVNEGIIVPIKSMRGFYKLNDSLRRLGLREVPEVPRKVSPRTTEDIIRLAFHAIDPLLFPPPSWLQDVEVIDGLDADHATVLMERYADAVAALDTAGEKHSFMQGVLDIDYMSRNNLGA